MTGDGRAGDVRREALAAVEFAAARLGPSAARYLGDPAKRALLAARLRGGADAQDAALGVVFDGVARHPDLANEFLAFFLAEMGSLGRGALAPGLRRFLDTGDLVQSVLGDLWPDWTELRFETRSQFLALLQQRFQWKATDRARGLRAGKRREEMRVAAAPDDVGAGSDDPSPATLAQDREEWERLVLVLCKLPERDRELLRLHLAGASPQEMADRMGSSAEALRKALQRALARARELA